MNYLHSDPTRHYFYAMRSSPSPMRFREPVPEPELAAAPNPNLAKERYLRALAASKAARKAYADAIAEEELRRLDDERGFAEQDPRDYLGDELAYPHEHPVRHVHGPRLQAEPQHVHFQPEARPARRQPETATPHDALDFAHALRSMLDAALPREAFPEPAWAPAATRLPRAPTPPSPMPNTLSPAEAREYARTLRAAMDEQEQAQVEAQQEKPMYRQLGSVTPQPSSSAPAPATSTAALPQVSISIASTPKAAATPKPALPRVAPEPVEEPLVAIATIRDTFNSLKSSFVFPSTLDFSSAMPGQLAHSTHNQPVHAYITSLSALLVRLDAVDSAGDEDVRKERANVVRDVEAELEGVERDAKEIWRAMWEAAMQEDVENAIEEVVVAEEIADATPTEEALASGPAIPAPTEKSVPAPSGETMPPSAEPASGPAQAPSGVSAPSAEDKALLSSQPVPSESDTFVPDPFERPHHPAPSAKVEDVTDEETTSTNGFHMI